MTVGPPVESCQICGAGMQPRYTISASRRWGVADADLRVYWCKDCDTGFLLPRPSSELLESLYSDAYFSNYGKMIERTQSLLDKARLNLAWRFDRGTSPESRILEVLAGRHPATICDLGCGNGTLLAKLRDRGFDVVGIEPSPHARREVQAKGITVYEGTAEAMPASIPEAPFDLVVTTQVLEHCLDPQLAVHNAFQLVRPGGYLVIDVPNCGSFQFANRGPAWFHFDVGRHVNYFTTRGLSRLIEGHPVESIKFYYRQYLDHFLPSRLAIESSLWERCSAEEDSSNLIGIRRPSNLENWWSLLQSFAMRPEHKYGCMGIIARKR
jgi:SAM-dependent methyltransferase